MHRIRIAAVATLALTSASAQAYVIDFVDMIEHGAYGESAYSTLTIAGAGFNLDITGTKNGQDGYAYLDWSHAGLGVCGAVSSEGAHPGSGTNVCNPSSDDNVTMVEALHFVFDANVVIDRIWFNNTHDPDLNIIAPEDYIVVDGANTDGPGNGYATGNPYNAALAGAPFYADVDNYLGPYSVAAGYEFTIAYGNQQFYISGLEVHAVPEPGTLALLGIGLAGMGLLRRRKNT